MQDARQTGEGNRRFLQRWCAGYVAACIVLASTAGCASREKPDEAEPQAVVAPKPPLVSRVMASIGNLLPKGKPKPPAAQTPQWAGTVRMVNAIERFVLIEATNIGSAVPGANYVAVANSSETAVLRMTDLKNPPFLIADIVSGSPSEGDKIYLPRAAAPNPPPAPPTPPEPATPTASPAPAATPAPARPKPSPKPARPPRAIQPQR